MSCTINKDIYKVNKYTNWYFNIINKAKTRPRPEGYTENHHILPEACGGPDEPENMARLTAREHFICHLILPKILVDKKHICSQNHAIWMMCNAKSKGQKRNYKVTSIIYNKLKIEFSKTMKFIHKGKIISDETKKKMSQASKGKKKTEEHIKNMKNKFTNGHIPKNKGIPHSDETKRKMKEAWKTRPPITDETKRKLSESGKRGWIKRRVHC